MARGELPPRWRTGPDCLTHRRNSLRSGLQVEDAAKPSFHVAEEFARKVADVIGEVSLIQGDQRGDVDDAVPRETGGGAGEEHIAGHGRQPGVRGDDSGEYRGQTASIVDVGGNDEHRSSFGWARPPRSAKVSPVKGAA
jgi:hypothetical protein